MSPPAVAEATPMQNQQQCAQNTATHRRGECDEARPDQKTKEGCSPSLGRWPAIVVHHLRVPPTCTGFLRETLWSSGSFIAERERPSIFQPFYSASNVDDGVPEPQHKLCECDVGIIQQPAQSAQLMQFDVEDREDEENGTEELHAGTDDKDVAALHTTMADGTEELHAGTDDKDVAALHTTMADGSGDKQRALAFIEHYLENPVPEVNYDLVTTTCGTMPVTLMQCHV